MKKNILVALTASLFAGSNISAQVFGDKDMILLATQRVSLGYQDTVFYVPYLSNTDVTVESDASWITAEVNEKSKKIRLAIEATTSPEKRTGVVRVTNADKSFARTFTVDQTKENYAVFAPSNKLPIASASASSSQSGEGIERTYDGNSSTLWHSSYGGVTFPVTLTYNFDGVEQIDYLRYIPRTSGKNGCFKEVEVWVKTVDADEFVKMGTYDFGGNNSPYDVYFDEPIMNPASIQFKVLSATTEQTVNFASCAEMEFYISPENTEDPNQTIFTSDLWDGLQPDVTQKEVDALTNPYSKFVAQQLLDNADEFTKDRIASYECVLSPEQLSALWNTPGKYYDHLQGVTGINISKGTSGVAVSGLPNGKTATLKVVAWYAGENAGPAEYSYTLQNGLNIINYTSNYDGLAYIAYFADSQEEEATAPAIKVHFINGSVNGYLSPDRDNGKLDTVLMNAKNRCIDLVGEKVHSIWQVSGMRNYCKNMENNDKGYVQFINVLDTLVGWEHHLLGFDKYNRVPKNRTCAYVNYTYYMFQGYYGVSFMYDQEPRVLNCNTIMKNDGDAIWGLSHEWGHQHQMQPYFCWAGLGESSNNMNSCENVLRMGYHDNYHAGRIKSAWNGAYATFFTNVNNTYQSELDDKGEPKPTYWRMRSYEWIDRFSWCPAVQAEIRRQYATYYKNGAWQIPSIASDPEHAISTSEVNVEQNTAPFYMLHNYFSYTLPKEGDSSKKDFQLDLYEALRQTDDPNGSVIEPGKTEVDKYELLASAQNGNKNGKYDEFVKDYPNSCWVTKGYIRKGATWTQNSVPFIFNYIRKASRISGYNLFDYFDKFGFLRTIIMTIGDYGDKDYVMMEDMKAEFKADMEALNLKEVDDEMMEKIAHSDLPVYPTPVIPNEPVK